MTVILIFAIAVTTWMLRASFLAGSSNPEWLGRLGWLQRLVPAAVLTALVASPLTRSDPAGRPAFILAALVAGAAAWRTRNMAVTVAAGLAVMWMVG